MLRFFRRGRRVVEPAGEAPREEGMLFVAVYPIQEPYVYAGVEKRDDGLRYVVVEPSLSDSERALLDRLKVGLKRVLEVDVGRFGGRDAAADYLRREARKVLELLGVSVYKSVFDKLMYYLERDLLWYGAITPLMKDPLIEDVSCSGPGLPVYVWHRDFESLPTNVVFEDEESLNRLIRRLSYLSGRHISVAQPIVDASLPDGSRIQMTYGSEVTKKGSSFTIRKFREDPLTIVDLIRLGTLSSDMAALLWFVIEFKGSILVCGPTASGKTTTINCLSMFIRPEAKIVTIEDTPEINLAHSNWVQSVSRPATAGVGEVTLYDLLKAALRQRPDFIIVGEIRGEEASTFFQAVSTGHSGLSSIHADSVQAALRRLTSAPMNIPRTLIPAINFILFQARVGVKDVFVRKILSVTEVVGVDPRTEEFIVNDVYGYSFDEDRFVFRGRSYVAERIAENKGMGLEELKRNLEEKKMVLEWMASKNIRNYREVTAIVGRYYRDKEALLTEARLGL